MDDRDYKAMNAEVTHERMTAVEWLHIEFQKRFPKETNEMYNNNQFDYEDMIIKAKEMEKQQIEQAFDSGHLATWNETPEQYYNKTFKNTIK